ncbi:hypothetical protein ROZALSC1DRAFT_27449 [Rozella allomycis CSF55]|uniref:SLA2-like Endocytosis protein and ANTH domain-containing protein n=1 Tax=Rozella allomycis (strain CSF55) TaxID=988480 RepID=A0A075ANZ6_ROZAC|nr:SLA2-like Endocytosis protein and ANTH domain-containing protein [Rozella allomycis CSF55]RKP21117.1 hypothetical protein ROZALSC1DRAFT_27449 [Rozella allomycis CSF55]|eukprot:EPZ31702.1 SLA2-like Endocytosis protein and ANTH domain-containing protein [Rozella allomycis CSF55]
MIPNYAEQELCEHIRKALNNEETAPKQKHVRAIIVFAFDYGTSGPFWNMLGLLPIFSDEIVCFKSLITIHKLVSSGPPICIKDAIKNISILDNCDRYASEGYMGYSVLIKLHVKFLKKKLELHKIHPEFTGSFDFKEYIALKRVDDPNDGYLTISELMDLQDSIEQFQHTVFSSFRPSSNNECRISSLVPLIEESFGIYQFVTSLLKAMFNILSDDCDVLLPLVDKYKIQFTALRKFYDECRNIRFLSTLVNIPQLPQNPPDFSKCSSQAISRSGSQNLVVAREPETTLVETTVTYNHFQEQQNQEMSQQIQTLLLQNEMGKQALQQYQQHLNDMQFQIQRYNSILVEKESSYMQSLNAANEETSMWRNKFEGMSKIYQGLRGEHLELLQKYTKLSQSSDKKGEMNQKVEALKAELEKKSVELIDKQGALERLRNDLQEEKSRNSNFVINTKSHLEQLVASLQNKNESLSNEIALKDIEIKNLKSDLLMMNEKLEAMKQNADNEIASLKNALQLETLQTKELQNREMVLMNEIVDLKNKLGDENKSKDLDAEMKEAFLIVQNAIDRLGSLKSDAGFLIKLDKNIHEKIIETTMNLMDSIAKLIYAATLTQKEIVSQGKDTANPDQFYKKNSRWTDGLISAAKSVALTCKFLVEAADGVLNGTNVFEELVVASHEVTASTSQLLSASRVKAYPNSQALKQLEQAAKQVSEANKLLVQSVDNVNEEGDVTNAMKSLSMKQYKVLEMKQQVEIMTLEKHLSVARKKLTDMRKLSYHTSDETIE